MIMKVTKAIVAATILLGESEAFMLPSTEMKSRYNSMSLHTSSNNDANQKSTTLSTEDTTGGTRRLLFSKILQIGIGSSCACCCLTTLHPPLPANALAQITTPPTELLSQYDLPRNQIQDTMFAQGMAVGMVDYEKEAYPKKKELFTSLFFSLKKSGTTDDDPVVVEVGMGSFPNALYYKKRLTGLDIVGVDPNDRMEGYARDSAARAGLLREKDGNGSSSTLRIVHGVSEALPFEDNSADAIVCTLTLCSVLDPARSVAEMKRVLKPGGKLLFWEHVLSQTDVNFARKQVEMTPNQVKRADGCHLDRETGVVIEAAGFRDVKMEYLELTKFGFIAPTVCGIATV